jgi:hypothetical protein
LKIPSPLRPIKKFFYNRQILVFKVDYKYLVLLFLLVFGIYGWGTFDSSSNIFFKKNLIITLSIVGSLAYFYGCRHRIDEILPTLRIKSSHLVIFSLIFGTAVTLNFTAINYSLTGDELFYAYQSQIQSLELLTLIRDSVPSNILNMIAKQVYQVLSITILIIGIAGLVLLMRIKSDRVFFMLSLIVLLTTRQFIQTLNANSHVHSPLPSFWYFLNSTTFGYSTIVYRTSTLILYCLLATFIYFHLANKSFLQKLCLGLICLLLFSIPLLNSMSLIIEPANWTFLVCVAFITIFVKNNFNVTNSHILILSSAFYFRTNLIFLLAVLIFANLYLNIKAKKFDKLILLQSGAVILPGLLVTLLTRISNRLDAESSILAGFSTNFGNTLHSITLSHSTLYALLGVLSFSVLLFNTYSRVFVILYLLFSSFLFFGLQFPLLSKYCKYQAEYLYPLVIVLPIIMLVRYDRLGRLFTICLVSVLISINAFGSFIKPEVSKSFSKQYRSSIAGASFGAEVLPSAPFPYEHIFETIVHSNLSGCLNSGVVYSSFPEILGGYTLREALISSDVRTRFLNAQSKFSEGWVSISAKTLDEAQITCVILGTVTNQSQTVNELLKSNWRIMDTEHFSEFGTSVYLMVKI